MSKTITKEINIEYVPTKYQMDLHQNLKSNFKDKIHAVKAMRQIGKSICLEMILLKNALEKPNTNNYEVSPTFNQASKVYKDIKDAIGGTPLLKRANETKLMLTLYNGSNIRFFSAEMGDNLRGYTCDLLCIDEAAYIDDAVFYSCILPWANVRQSPIVMFSTPRYKTGFFYKYFNLGETTGRQSRYFCYDWSKYDTSQFLSDEKKEEFRLQLPRQTYLSEICGEWLDLEGSVFGNFDNCVMMDKPKWEKGEDYYFGVDWGTGQGGDDTAIAVFNEKKEMKAIYHFNDKDETTTISFIAGLIKQYKPLKVQVETNSIGSVFMGLLKKKLEELEVSTTLIGFNTSNETKNQLVNNLQVAIQNESVRFINDPALIMQLSMYEGKPSKTGKMTYNAPNGYHDDCVIATMLALNCINKGKPDVFFI